jgi:hypothetical protein
MFAATNRKQHCRDIIWNYFVIDHREYCIHHAFKSTTIVLPSICAPFIRRTVVVVVVVVIPPL